jgi:hypothetical protein
MPAFENSRSLTIAASADAVRGLVTDFHKWIEWSPWEGLDADLERTYSGAESGVGARYAWAGKKAGAGTMRITAVAADRVDVDLDFEKPMKASNKVVFRFEPEGSGTRVTWTMSGTRNVLLAILGPLFFDGMIGKDFEKGLAQMKAIAER